jgi:hypothetical protein
VRDESGAKFPETSVLTRAKRRNIPVEGILHSHGRENLKSYITLTDLALYWRSYVYCEVRNGFYIPEDGIHSYVLENLKFYTILTGWTL